MQGIISRRGGTYRRRLLDAMLAERLSDVTGGVLDVGGKKAHRRGTFRIPLTADRWVAVNIDPGVRPEVVGDAAMLPIASESFDRVVCCELLEHVADPAGVCREIHRVLVPGGCAVVTVPFLYPVHGDPFDFHRFTPGQLERMLAPFERVEVEPMGGWSGTVGMLLELGVRDVRRGAGARPLRVAGRVLGRLLVRFDRPGDGRFTTGYFCTAYKKIGPVHS